METFVRVGKLGKVHGLEGFLRLHLEEVYLKDVANAGVLFAGHPRTPLPYFIESVKGGPVLLVRFEEMTSRDAAAPLSGEDIFLRESDISEVSDQQDSADYEDLAGYQVHDAQAGPVGEITEVLEYPQQWMAIIQREEGQEIMIPLNEVFVQAIDEDKRIVHTDLPEGLLSL
jgi:16S rRNA processing protein RimM